MPFLRWSMVDVRHRTAPFLPRLLVALIGLVIVVMVVCRLRESTVVVVVMVSIVGGVCVRIRQLVVVLGCIRAVLFNLAAPTCERES